MLFSVILSILETATAAIFQQQLIWRKSKMVEMIESGEYAAFVKYQNSLRSSAFVTIHQRILEVGFSSCVGNITIGTPEQQFTVVLDTGSDFMWVPGIECDASCEGKDKFDPNSSTTFTNSSSKWEITYEIGSAEGYLASDNMKFGGLHEPQLAVANTTFGLATHIAPQYTRHYADGILGLAFDPRNQSLSPLANAIYQGLLDRPVFTFWMQRMATYRGEASGMLTYGGIDKYNCRSIIAWEPMTCGSEYTFKISAIGMRNFTHRSISVVAADTGSPFIFGQKAVTDQLARVVDATFNATLQLYMIKCNATLPTLDITIGQKIYRVEPANFAVQEVENDCFLLIRPTEFGGLGEEWIFGTPFNRQYCTIFDVGKSRIGFAWPRRN